MDKRIVTSKAQFDEKHNIQSNNYKKLLILLPPNSEITEFGAKFKCQGCGEEHMIDWMILDILLTQNLNISELSKGFMLIRIPEHFALSLLFGRQSFDINSRGFRGFGFGMNFRRRNDVN